ncbi:hypothetical protein ACVWWN_001729 [Mycobacterium sp. URHB0021]|jgi:hypothetical protein
MCRQNRSMRYQRRFTASIRVARGVYYSPSVADIERSTTVPIASRSRACPAISTNPSNSADPRIESFSERCARGFCSCRKARPQVRSRTSHLLSTRRKPAPRAGPSPVGGLSLLTHRCGARGESFDHPRIRCYRYPIPLAAVPASQPQKPPNDRTKTSTSAVRPRTEALAHRHEVVPSAAHLAQLFTLRFRGWASQPGATPPPSAARSPSHPNLQNSNAPCGRAWHRGLIGVRTRRNSIRHRNGHLTNPHFSLRAGRDANRRR